MKKTILLTAIVIGLCMQGSFAADMKIGVVNLQKCFEEYYKTKHADATLKDAAEAYAKERKQLIDEFQKLQEERNKLLEELNKPELSEEKKKEKQKESEAKLTELRKQNEQIQEFDRVRRQQLQDQGNRMRGGIVKEITEQVNKIAKAQNFTLMFDSSGNSMNATPIVVFAEDRLDITLDVVRELNRNAPPPEAKPATPKSDEPAKPAAPAPAPAK